MRAAFYSVRQLYRDGKLHRKLLIRIALLLLVAILTLLVITVDVALRNLPILPTILFMLPGFLFGFFIMSKISAINWDERRELIVIGRFDVFGFLILIAYFLVRFKTGEYISTKYSDAFFISGYTLALFSGIIVGRLIGITKRIHRVSLGQEFERL